MSALSMRSALGIGTVSHSRTIPVTHRFKYPVMMPLLDLQTIEKDLQASRWWSAHRANLASYRRGDHFGDETQSLDDAVRDEVEQQLGFRPIGSVMMLAHLRYWGHTFNPISLFFCCDDNGVAIACLAEVHNTPWGQRVLYAMPVPAEATTGERWRWTHSNAKGMHVSPFLAMGYHYQWRIAYSEAGLKVSIVNHAEDDDKQRPFMANLNLRWQPLQAKAMNWALVRYPAQTISVVWRIHWHALLLWLKGVPYIPHPHPDGVYEPAAKTAAKAQSDSDKECA